MEEVGTNIWSLKARRGPSRDLNPDYQSTALALKRTCQTGRRTAGVRGLQKRPSQRQGERRVGSGSSGQREVGVEEGIFWGRSGINGVWGKLV